MPTNATIHIQKIAPGPPSVSATATPAILPVPTRLASDTGGEVIELDRLDAFVRDLPNRKVPVTEPVVYPVWHHWSMFALVVGLFVCEWGLRRWKGLP